MDKVSAKEKELKSQGYTRSKDGDSEYSYKWTKEGKPTWRVNYRTSDVGEGKIWMDESKVNEATRKEQVLVILTNLINKKKQQAAKETEQEMRDMYLGDAADYAKILNAYQKDDMKTVDAIMRNMDTAARDELPTKIFDHSKEFKYIGNESKEQKDMNKQIKENDEEGKTAKTVDILNKLDKDGFTELKTENEEGCGTDAMAVEVAVVEEKPAAVPEETKTPEENIEKAEGSDEKEEEIVEECKGMCGKGCTCKKTDEGKLPENPGVIENTEETIQDLKESDEEKAVRESIEKADEIINKSVRESQITDFNSLFESMKEIE